MARQPRPREGFVRIRCGCTAAAKKAGRPCTCEQVTYYAMCYVREHGRFKERSAEHKEVCRCRGRHRNGQRRCRCGAENKALAAAQEVQARINAGTDTGLRARSERVLLDDYFEEWITERQLANKTRRGYRTHYRKDIAPRFGRTPVDEITTPMVQKWVVHDLEPQGLKRKTVQAKLKLLQNILATSKGKSALRDELIDSNPCWGVTIGVVDPEEDREANTYTWEEIEAILAQLDPYWRVMVRTQLDAACRWNELQGFQVRDLTPDDHLRLMRVIDEGTKAEMGNGTAFAVVPHPKNQQWRQVKLTPEVAAMLREHIADRGLTGEDFLFSARVNRYNNKPQRTPEWPSGRPIYRSTWHANWTRAMERAGVPIQVENRYGTLVNRRPYDLRATHATLLLDAGVDKQIIRDRLGHRDERSLERYLAKKTKDQAPAVEAMRQFYRSQ